MLGRFGEDCGEVVLLLENSIMGCVASSTVSSCVLPVGSVKGATGESRPPSDSSEGEEVRLS